jgi:hypothetical protein
MKNWQRSKIGNDYDQWAIYDDSEHIATVNGLENAMVVEAAPDLLEALKKASAWIKAQVDTMNDEQRSDYDYDVITTAQQAIQKATQV